MGFRRLPRSALAGGSTNYSYPDGRHTRRGDQILVSEESETSRQSSRPGM